MPGYAQAVRGTGRRKPAPVGDTILPLSQQERGKGGDAASFGAFGTPVLSLRPFTTKLKTKVPDILKPQIKNHENERLYKCALNLATQRGFSLESKIPRNTKEVNDLIGELNKKCREGVFLYKDEDGHLRLTIETYAYNDFTTYFIPIRPAYDLRPALNKLLLRFIKTLKDSFKIGDITDQNEFDASCETMKENIETYKNNPEYSCDEEEAEKLNDVFRYEKGGAAYSTLLRLNKMKAVTREEIEEFRTRTTWEELLKKKMLKLMQYVESGFNIEEYSSFKDPFSENYDYDTDYGVLLLNSIFTVIYEFDGLLEEYMSWINTSVQGGAEEEYLRATWEILPEGEIPLLPNLKMVFNAVSDFLEVYLDDDNIPKKSKKKSKCQTTSLKT